MDNKETETQEEIDTIDIIPKKINITVETNIEGEAPFPLTYDKIYNPVKSDTLPQPKNPDYPYFVSNVKYSEKVLMSYLIKDYSFILLSFFDKKYFSNMIQDFSKETKPKEGEQHVNHNIFLTLLFLFPMRYPRPANINTSYSKYICKDGNQKYTDLINIYQSGKNTTSALLRNMRDIETSVREYSYVNTSKGEATVTQIVWLNDVLNNPKYRELIDLLIQYESWVKNKRITINNDINTAIIDLIDTSKDSITDDDIKLINDQQNTAYSKNDFIEDILKTVFEYIYYDEGGNQNIGETRKQNLKETIETTKTTIKTDIQSYINNPGKDTNDKNAKIDANKIFEYIEKVVFDINAKQNRVRRNDYQLKPILMDYFKFNDEIENPSIVLRIINETNKSFQHIVLKKIKVDNEYIENFEINLDNGVDNEETFSEYEAELDLNGGVSHANSRPNSPVKGTRKDTKNYKKITSNKKKKTDENTDKSKSNENKNNIIIMTKNIRGQLYGIIVSNFLDKFSKALFLTNEFEIFKKQLIKNIKNYVDRYNQNTVRSSQLDNRNINLFIDIDIRIKKAVEELKLLNQALKSKQNNAENFKKIVNAVDSLKTFFTDQSIKENRLTEVSTIKQNFEKILKKTNIIKTLKYIQENILESKGINLNYKSESSEFNAVLTSELEKEKYSYFMNTVATINKDFLNIQTTNQTLETIVKDYFNNRSNDLIKTLIVPAKKAINENTLNDCKDHYMETGVSITTSSAKKLYEYEINIYMEVVIGKVDYQTQNNIKCDYRDEKLVAYFNRDSMNANKFEIVKSKAINLNKQPIQNNEKKQPIQNNEKKTKGGKSRRKKKYLQNNKRYTSKRR